MFLLEMLSASTMEILDLEMVVNEEYDGSIDLMTKKDNWTLHELSQRKVVGFYSVKTTPCSGIGSIER